MKLILLCGGRSERMGEPKGLLPVPDGDFFLLEQCAAFFRAGGVRVTVVLGFDFELYLKKLGCLQAADDGFFLSYQNRKISFAINRNPQMGPFSSIQTGILSLCSEAVPADTLPRNRSEGVFILPVDVPCPGADVFADLHQGNQNVIKVCVPVWAGRGGHPVWLSDGFCQALLAVKPGENYRLDRQINTLSVHEIKRVDVQEACVCYNLNRPEDWLRYLCERKELK